MKKITLALLFLSCSLFTAKASHLLGGDMTVHVDSTNSAQIILTLYRDNGQGTISLGPNSTVTVSGPGAFNQMVSLSIISVDTLPDSYPVTRHIYTGSLSLPAPGTYTAGYSDCCRNMAIMNATNPSAESMYINTNFTSYINTPGSSPIFLNAPILSFPLDTLWTYNPLPYDADGDSLYWTIDTPLTQQNLYINGYTTPPGNAGGALTMDPQTGVISWSASQLGNYVTSILVQEFRNGIKIGEIRRDMQFIVVNDTSSLQMVLPPGFSGTATPSASILAGQSTNYTFELTSNSATAAPDLEAAGDPFQTANSNADFQVQSTGASTVEGTFTWNPASADIRTKPYRLTLRASDDEFVYDFTVLIQVNGAVSLNENFAGQDELHIFPNPGSGDFKVAVNAVADKPYSIQVIDMQGKLIKEITVDTHNWTEQLSLQLNAPAGTYILKTVGAKSMTKVFVIK